MRKADGEGRRMGEGGRKSRDGREREKRRAKFSIVSTPRIPGLSRGNFMERIISPSGRTAELGEETLVCCCPALRDAGWKW